MRALVFHISSLVGLLVLINQLWSTAEIERTLVLAFTAGLSLYMVLMVGYVLAQRIMNATPAGTESPEEGLLNEPVPGGLHEEPALDSGEQPTPSL